jgi:predicted metalloendopeptidase
MFRLQNVDSFYEAFDIKEDQNSLYLKPEDVLEFGKR